MYAIEVEHLVKKYKEHLAVNDISFGVRGAFRLPGRKRRREIYNHQYFVHHIEENIGQCKHFRKGAGKAGRCDSGYDRHCIPEFCSGRQADGKGKSIYPGLLLRDEQKQDSGAAVALHGGL